MHQGRVPSNRAWAFMTRTCMTCMPDRPGSGPATDVDNNWPSGEMVEVERDFPWGTYTRLPRRVRNGIAHENHEPVVGPGAPERAVDRVEGEVSDAGGLRAASRDSPPVRS